MTIKIGYEQGYQQGKAEAAEWMKARDDALAELSTEIAALRAENARLQADGIHSCHDGCTRSGCVNARLRAEILEADECITQSVKEEAALQANVERKYAALIWCQKLFRDALPKFNWGASALDANAIRLLNEVPGIVAAALPPTPTKEQACLPKNA